MADRVTVIGWDGSPLTAAATVRALAPPPSWPAPPTTWRCPRSRRRAERIRLGSVDLAARRIAGHRGSAVVLADGDPGFFGVVRTLRAPEHGLEVEVVPAVSSVATAFARAGMPWDDAQVVVAHRRTLRRAVNVCRAHPKVAVLTSPGAGPAELALLLEGVHRTFVICEELGTDREQVTVLTSDKAADHAWRDPNVVIVIGGAATAAAPTGGWIAGRDPGYRRRVRGWALPAEAYGRHRTDSGEGESPQLRAAQLARLGPRTGDLVWDIGSGSGALAVEAARFGAAVIAVDRDPDACARTAAAARALRRPAPGRPRAAPRTCWSACPSPTSYGSAAAESPSSPPRRPAARAHRHPRLDPRRGRGASARRWRTAATPSSAPCSSPSNWTPRPGRSGNAPSSSCSPAARSDRAP